MALIVIMQISLEILPLEILAIIFTDSYSVWCSSVRVFRCARGEYMQMVARERFLLTVQHENAIVTYLNTDNGQLIHSVDDKPALVTNKYKYWYRFNKIHRDNDLPAVKNKNGKKMWYQGGKLHRLNGPASVQSRGDTRWYQNGKLHRIDGPALYNNNDITIAYSYWYKNGKLHRDGDLPAVEFADGTKKYYKNNNLHRINGPAIVNPNGTEYWYKKK
jgi:hypothetical protein